MSRLNPLPADVGKAVLVWDDEETRLRRADEATESGQSVEHTRFIVSVNVGVRLGGRREHSLASTR